MAKKGKHDQVLKILEQFDPKIAAMIDARYYGGQQLYDPRTHRVRSEYVDQAQVDAILIGVRDKGIALGSPCRFSKDELRRLSLYSIDGQ